MAGKGEVSRHGRINKWLLYKGVRQGLLGGSPLWLLLGGLAAGLRLIRRLSGSGTEIAYCEELATGQTLVITHGHEPR